MPFINAPTEVNYTATAAQTDFSFYCKWFNISDMIVYHVPVGEATSDAWILPQSAYTIIPTGANIGGTVILNTGAATGDTIIILRKLPITRDIEYTRQGDLLAATLNNDEDYQTYLIQDLEQSLSKFIYVQPGTDFDGELPAGVPYAYLIWNSTGTQIINDDQPPIWRDETEAFAIQAAADAAAAAQSAADAAASEASVAADAAAATAAAASADADAIQTAADRAWIDGRLDLVQTNGNTVQQNINVITTDPVKTQLANAAQNAADAEQSAIDAAASAASIDPLNIVHKTGAETIAGIKSFTDNMLLMAGKLFHFFNVGDTFSTTLGASPTANRALILPDESDTLATRSYANSLFYEYEVVGSAATTIDIPNLDINTHKSYRIEVEILNPTASAGSIGLFFNGYTTLTDYYRQHISGSASAVTANNLNNPNLLPMEANIPSTLTGIIELLGTAPIFLGVSKTALFTTMDVRTIGLNLRSGLPQTNITQLTLTATVAGMIGIGSKVRIYRGDV